MDVELKYNSSATRENYISHNLISTTKTPLEGINLN
jgi:hypothetical protein